MQFTVNLTKLQVEELRYKMGIIEEDDDLRESYELTTDEVQQLIAILNLSNGGAYIIPNKFADVMVGELENLLDIWRDNYLAHRASSPLAYASTIKSAIKKIEAAAVSV